MHKFRITKGKTAWVALKLDMEKAYDRLEWDFIRACLQRYGFHSRFINLSWNVLLLQHTLSWLMVSPRV